MGKSSRNKRRRVTSRADGARGRGTERKVMGRSSIEAYTSIGIAIVSVFSIPFWARDLLLFLGASLWTDIAYQAPWTINLHKRVKLGIAALAWCAALWVSWHTYPKPSFIYVAPAIWTADGRWDFVVGHRGADPVNRVQILVRDQDWVKYTGVLQGKSPMKARTNRCSLFRKSIRVAGERYLLGSS